MTDFPLTALLDQLAEERALDLRGYKKTSLERRFRHRMKEIKVESFRDYADLIRRNPAEVTELLNTVLINVTQFFRDPEAWQVLQNEVLPMLTEDLKPGGSFRVWTAGCATGEEAYTLAIILSEFFGPRLKDINLKIYATDVDDHALGVARRGEYPLEKLKNVPAPLIDKYFLQGESQVQLLREIRRMVIFGRSNLAFDAPISHVNLLACRNVLIYLDVQLQKQILGRLHYALDPNGVLMLGKSETQLSQSILFRPLHSKWRIFQRVEQGNERIYISRMGSFMQDNPSDKSRQEIAFLKLYQEAILETLEPGILVLDVKGNIITENDAALRLWALQDRKLVGQNLQESELLTRCKELTSRLESTFQPGHPTVRFECTVPVPEKSEDRVLSVTIKPILSEGGKGRAGTLLYVEDVSPRHRLQHTIEELETTGEELQSTNEELETTNEELQSANEELETTNEELQSTNEELETTNEELQALNEELGTTNEELEVRTRELDDMNALHSETLERIPWPVMLVGEDLTLQVWNPAVQKLFGLGSRSIIGLTLSQLPVDSALRARLVRHHQNVIASNKPSRIPAFQLKTASFKGVVDVKFTPLLHLEKRKGVLIVMEMSKDGSNGSASPRNVLPRVVEKKLSANGKRNGGTNSKQNAKKSLKPRKK